jgi:hypothetical protein
MDRLSEQAGPAHAGPRDGRGAARRPAAGVHHGDDGHGEPAPALSLRPIQSTAKPALGRAAYATPVPWQGATCTHSVGGSSPSGRATCGNVASPAQHSAVNTGRDDGHDTALNARRPGRPRWRLPPATPASSPRPPSTPCEWRSPPGRSRAEDRRARPAIPRSMSFCDTCVAPRYSNGPTS